MGYIDNIIKEIHDLDVLLQHKNYNRTVTTVRMTQVSVAALISLPYSLLWDTKEQVIILFMLSFLKIVICKT